MTDLEALDRFVCDNDDLGVLEARVGRFNVFDALGVATAEIRHSNFLAWLLNPSETHGLGAAFLRPVLMDVLRRVDPTTRPLSPAEVDGEPLGDVEVRREWRNIDLLLVHRHPPHFVIAVENKVFSGEHSNQLARYRQTVLTEFPGLKPLFVFLTPDGDVPSDDEWVAYGYSDLYRILSRATEINATSMNADVAAFVRHYLRLVATRYMPDPDLDALCDRLYANHRQALDLIFARIKEQGRGLLSDIRGELESRGSWLVLNVTGRRVDCQPAAWADLLPPIGSIAQFKPTGWLRVYFDAGKNHLRFYVQVGPTDDQEARNTLIKALTHPDNDLGLKLGGSNVTGKWTRLMTKRLVPLDQGLPTDAEGAMAAIRKHLDGFEAQSQKITAALAKHFSDHADAETSGKEQAIAPQGNV